MAKPIEPTPVLEGKNATTFLKVTNSVKYDRKKEKFLKECKEVFKSTIQK